MGSTFDTQRESKSLDDSRPRARDAMQPISDKAVAETKDEVQSWGIGAAQGAEAGAATGGAIGAAGGGLAGWGVGVTQGALLGLVAGMFLGCALSRKK